MLLSLLRASQTLFFLDLLVILYKFVIQIVNMVLNSLIYIALVIIVIIAEISIRSDLHYAHSIRPSGWYGLIRKNNPFAFVSQGDGTLI